MKWRSHRQITELVAEALDLPDDLAELLIEASVDPDRNALKRVEKRRGRYAVKRVRHHRHSGDELIRLLWRARESYLDGDDEDAVLGRQLEAAAAAGERRGERHESEERQPGEDAAHQNRTPSASRLMVPR